MNGSTRPRKYLNQKVEVSGVKCDSKAEAERLIELQIAQKAGIIRDLEPHPKYSFYVYEDDRIFWIVGPHTKKDTPPNAERLFSYTADSRYIVAEDGRRVVEDVKSEHTQATASYRLKKRFMKAVLGIEVTEIMAR